MSADGRFVTFTTSAEVLWQPYLNDDPPSEEWVSRGDIYIYDREAGGITFFTFYDSEGNQVSQQNTQRAVIAPDGTKVAFFSQFGTYLAEIFPNLDTEVTALTSTDITFEPVLSHDGSRMAFGLNADGITEEDDNKSSDVFLLEVKSAASQISMVSQRADGTVAIGDSDNPRISADGKFIVFNSRANELIPDIEPNVIQIYRKSIENGEITLVSTSSNGEHGDRHAHQPDVSGDGRHVAFSSPSTNLVDGVDHGRDNVYVKDTESGEITLLSRSLTRGGGDGDSSHASISAEGRFVCFDSSASNLIPDWGGERRVDVYIADVMSGAIWLASAGHDGSPANGHSESCEMSDDGGFVVFKSSASNLISNDTNQKQDIYMAVNPFK